jgi:DNA-binding NtrC family response regulator
MINRQQLVIVTKATATLISHTHKKITTIVIDDDKEISDNLARYLAQCGYKVTNTYTGKEGLALIDQQHPRIALVDFKLPDINGIELLKSIKAASPETIIILISGYTTIDTAAEAIKNGAYDFMAKPFNFDELERTLRHVVEIKFREEMLAHLKKRNIILALTLPLWILLGYVIVSLLK